MQAQLFVRRDAREALVGPVEVAMHRVLGEHREKVALVDDRQPVQALAANGTDPALAEGVGSWRLRRGPEHADASTGEHVIDGQGDFRVPVARSTPHAGQHFTGAK